MPPSWALLESSAGAASKNGVGMGTNLKRLQVRGTVSESGRMPSRQDVVCWPAQRLR
jgi:hypothetical protein